MQKKVTNYIISGVLVLGVLGIGAVAYQQRAQADTVVAGYGTAHLHFNVTVPVVQTVSVKATFTPRTGKNFYFKERSFDINSTGLNTVEWYIRKIPGGTYTMTVTSPQGTLQDAPQEVTLKNDSVSDVGSFDLNLGSPPATQTPAPSATQTVENSVTSTATVEASGSQIPFPPIPSL
jgi:hypothetical protein